MTAAARSPLRIALFAALIAFCAGQRCQADDWPGWRGLEREGRSRGAGGPVHWSPTEGLSWKAALKGEGCSSPIVIGGQVVVTTARQVAGAGPGYALIRVALLVCMAILGALAGGALLRQCRESAGRPNWGRAYAALAAAGLLLALPAVVLLFGKALFGYEEAPERGWLAGSLLGTMLLCLAELQARQERRGRWPTGASLMAFAALAALTVPFGPQVFTDGPLSPRSALILVVVALPFLAGLALAAGAARETQGSRTMLAWLVRVVAALVVLTIAGAFIRARCVPGHDATTAGEYVPAIPAWLAGGLLAAGGGLVGLGRVPRQRHGVAALGVGVVSLGMLVAISALLEHVVAALPVVSYYAGEPRLVPESGWLSVALLAASAPLGGALAAIVDRRRPPRRRAQIAGFQVLAAVLVTGNLLCVRYLPSWSTYVRAIVFLDAETGAHRWTAEGLQGVQAGLHRDNTPATPTAVSDGTRIVGYFGSAGLLCASRDGKQLWSNREMPFESREGVGASPVLYDGRLFVLAESSLGGWLAALDPSTGRALWKVNRGKPIHTYAGNCRTPAVYDVAGRRTLVVWGLEDLSGYDPPTGDELWTHHLGGFGSGENPVACTVRDEERIYLVGLRRAAAVSVSRLSGGGSPLVWDVALPGGIQCSSPVLSGGLLFAVSDGGSAFCLDAATGRTLWRHSLGGQHYASLVAVGDRVYFTSTRGKTTVIAAERRFRKLGGGDLGERTLASAAPVGSRLYLRTAGHIYCIKGTSAPVSPPAAGERAPRGGLQTGLVAGEPVDWSGGNWAQFRGPAGTGAVPAGKYLTGWDATKGKGVLWRNDRLLPGKGSPVVWGARVFVTGADATRRVVHCFDAASGRALWERDAGPRTPSEDERDPTVGHAASTPLTDGRRVYAVFTDGTLTTMDVSGRPVWTRSLNVAGNSYGHAASLAYCDGRLLVQLDQEPDAGARSVLLAVDCATGDTVWEAEREVPSSWSTPLVIRAGRRQEIITCANPWVIAYAPESGREQWRASCLGGEVVPSPTLAGGLVAAANQGAACAAVRPGGTGDVTKTRVAWTHDDMLPDVCSPVGGAGEVFLLSSDGTVTCLRAADGKRVWEKQLGQVCSASPILVGGRLYVQSEVGTMFVLDTARRGVVVGRGVLPEQCQATPAFQGGRIFIRGAQHLYCIGERKGRG